jgi:hypothetical protein
LYWWVSPTRRKQYRSDAALRSVENGSDGCIANHS